MNRIFTLICLLITSASVFAQEIPFSESEYEQRKNELMESSLSNPNGNTFVIQAKKGLPVDQTTLDRALDRANTSGEFDFNLVQLVRILYFSNGEYDAQILPTVERIPFWITPNEKLRVYWSENHIIMWLSSAYLVKQKYGIDKVANAEQMVLHYLDQKIKYGYYEFFSPVYFPYTLSGLLNLVDFAENPEIKEKAILATERLLSEIMMLVNDKGVLFSCAGRSYPEKYSSAYNQNHSNVIYALTGLGEKPNNTSHGATHLVTSTFNPKKVVESWKSKEDLIFKFGHSIEEGKVFNSPLAKNDRIMFQFSSGAYFHPDVALETATLIDGYNLWEHKEFKAFSTFKGIPVQLAPVIAEVGASISKSSLISGQSVGIFKNKSVVLSSIQNYWKGRAGYQQWPWAATIGTNAVFTTSGEYKNIVDDNLNGNSTLPYIDQKSNVALIMYRPNKDLALFGLDRHDVSLNWKDEEFDEVVFEGQWIVGKKDENYVAVLRHCTDVTTEGKYICDDQDGQVWGVIVGNDEMYGSFSNFREIISKAKHKEEWKFEIRGLEWIYYGMIEVDGKKIEHYWNGNLLSAPQNPSTGIEYLTANDAGFNVYPNPARDRFAIAFTQEIPSKYVIRVHDITGRQVYQIDDQGFGGGTKVVETSSWATGLYTIIVETPAGMMSRKLMIQN